MKLLLDTHVVWWLLYEPERLGAKTLVVLDRLDIYLYYSPISMFELGLKRSTGSLSFDDASIKSQLDAQLFEELPLRREHALTAAALPRIHKDPFDRLLIGQAVFEGLRLVTRDETIMRYALPLMAV